MSTRRRTRWFTAGALLLVLMLAAMASLPEHSVRTELVIDATPAEIWAVLTDAEGYPAWNTVFTRVDGAYREGHTVELTLALPGAELMQIEATVFRMEAERELQQRGGTWGFLTFDHRWTLEPAASGTRVIQHEHFRGFGLFFWDASVMEPAYDRVNAALRARVASRRGGTGSVDGP